MHDPGNHWDMLTTSTKLTNLFSFAILSWFALYCEADLAVQRLHNFFPALKATLIWKQNKIKSSNLGTEWRSGSAKDISDSESENEETSE